MATAVDWTLSVPAVALVAVALANLLGSIGLESLLGLSSSRWLILILLLELDCLRSSIALYSANDA